MEPVKTTGTPAAEVTSRDCVVEACQDNVVLKTTAAEFLKINQTYLKMFLFNSEYKLFCTDPLTLYITFLKLTIFI